MKNNYKINILQASCILIIGALSLIQYYLVKNTYQLTKEKYYSEAYLAISKIMALNVVSDGEDKEIGRLKQLTWQYLNKEITKQIFAKTLQNTADSVKTALNPFIQKQMKSVPILRNMSYRLECNEIIVSVDKELDTLFSPSSKPIIFLGKLFQNSNDELVGRTLRDITRKESTEEMDLMHNDVKLKVNITLHLDGGPWENEIFKRMALVFFLALGLMLAVIFLFYMIFRIMLREKKISEIKTDFANNITHELKTPLASLHIILKSLNREEINSNPDKRKELLKSLDRQYHKIQHLVDNVLESSMSTELQIKLQKVNITDYLNQYVKDYTTYPLLANVEKQPRYLTLSIELIEKVLNNLIENAIKYSKESSPIHLNAYTNNHAYFIEIVDHGPGIAAQYLPYVFDKFYRVPERNIHTVKGLGIGLYLCKQAIEQLGGTITIKSKINEGSSFIIKLLIDEN